MAKKIDDAWNVLPHEPLEKLSDNLWRAVGSLKGMSLKRTMVVAKRSDGLVIHSGIAMKDEEQRKLEQVGEPAYLVVPNRGHRLDAPAYKKRYPKLRVFAPKGGRDAIHEMVPVDGTFEDFPGDDTVRLETLHGVDEQEGAMIVKSSDGTTVVLNDAVMNMDRKKDPLGFLFTTLLGSAPGPRVSRLVRMMYIKDRAAFRADLERFSDLPGLVRVVVAHEKVAHGEDAPAALKKAATYVS
jgi:hypothetical protein